MGSVMGPDVTAGTVLVAEAERGKKEKQDPPLLYIRSRLREPGIQLQT